MADSQNTSSIAPASAQASADKKASEKPPGEIECRQHPNDATSIGMVVELLHEVPPFSDMTARELTGTVIGQIRRGHYVLAVQDERVIGYVGWALASEEIAKGWAEGRHRPTYEESMDGDCVILMMWYAQSAAATRRLARFLRRLYPGYRFYGRRMKDGRPSRPLSVRDIQ